MTQEQEEGQAEDPYQIYMAGLNTISKYTEIRGAANTFVNQYLLYRPLSGATTEHLKQFIYENYNVPNTPQYKELLSDIQRQVILNERVDTRDLTIDPWNPMFAFTYKPKADENKATSSSSNTATHSSTHKCGQAQQQPGGNGGEKKDRPLTRAERVLQIKNTVSTIPQCTMMMLERKLHTNAADAKAECMKIMNEGSK
jgi:hypothetical protein